MIPSVIHFTENGETIVGEVAKNALLHKPESTIFSVKRLMGKSYADVENHNRDYSYKVVDDGTDKLVKVSIVR